MHAIYPNWGLNEAQFIDGAYVDGLSITHGINPRHHIWTYAAGNSENGTHDANCPCHGSNETTPGKIIIVSLLQQLKLLQTCFIPMTHCGMVNSVITMNLLAAPLLKCRGLLKL